MAEKSLIVVAGPTAVGKTSVAIQLARHFQTEIISADSRQLYREMSLGTAKPSLSERDEIPHYFVDTHSVVADYDAAAYAEDALKVIADVFRRKDAVIMCGGSGLYIKSVCEGFDAMPQVPDDIRRDLVENYQHQGLGWLQEQLRRQDPHAFSTIDQKNPHRLIRALEVKLYSGKSILSFRKSEKRKLNFDIIKIGLELPREELYARIDERMDKMIDAGLFEEARKLHPLRHHNALQTVGYQEIFGFIEGQYDYDECVRLLKRNSRRYAKRQLTWFKKDKEFTWFSPHDMKAIIEFVRGE